MNEDLDVSFGDYESVTANLNLQMPKSIENANPYQ